LALAPPLAAALEALEALGADRLAVDADAVVWPDAAP
jgi:hypothetical protein